MIISFVTITKYWNSFPVHIHNAEIVGGIREYNWNSFIFIVSSSYQHGYEIVVFILPILFIGP